MHKRAERLRAAAFDLDGTLVHTVPDLAAAANAMLAALGLPALTEPRIAGLVGGGVERLVEGALAERMRPEADAASLAKATALFRGEYAARVFDRSRVYPGVFDGLRRLRARGIPTCCVTNKHSAFALPLLDAAGLAGLLSFALCADGADQRKPAPDLLIAAGERLGVPPRRLLYVGDSRIDIATARAAGCPVAVVDYGYSHGLSLAEARPDWIVSSIADLATLPVWQRLG
jgi:phosphoglycolate phosphatase